MAMALFNQVSMKDPFLAVIWQCGQISVALVRTVGKLAKLGDAGYFYGHGQLWREKKKVQLMSGEKRIRIGSRPLEEERAAQPFYMLVQRWIQPHLQIEFQG